MQSLAAWRTVTVVLANARPACMGSTSKVSGVSGRAPRANTVCSDLSCLPSAERLAATTVWASSWPAEDHLAAALGDGAGDVPAVGRGEVEDVEEAAEVGHGRRR